MGKGGREANKAKRAEREARLLSELTRMIAKLWGTRAECVEAAALFAATADCLGIPVEARAVSILAIDTEEHRVSISGVAAGEDAKTRLGVQVAGFPDDTSERSFERAGHMILTSRTLFMIFDPTFRQFSKDGLLDAPIAGSVSETHPSTGKLVVEFEQGRFEVTYFFDDANLGWQEGFEWAKAEWAEVARQLNSYLRSGGTAATMTFEIPWEELPSH